MSNFSLYTTIVAVDRQPNYLEKTCETLEQQGIPYDISQGSLSVNNLFGINQSKHRVVFAPETNEENYNEKDVRYRAQTNYINALTMDNGCGSPETFRMVLEDDVVVCKDFFKHINEYLKAIVTGIGRDKIILSLYNPFHINTNEQCLLQMDVNLFWGLQAMIYSHDVCKGFAEYIREHICSEPHDFLIRDYCKKNNIAIYWVSLSLFQHIGETSTGLGTYHKTPNFVDDKIA